MDDRYIAGFFDGEGCVGVYRRGTHYSLLVQLTQVDTPETERLLNALRDRFGGTVGRRPSLSGRGVIAWSIGSDGAATFLETIAEHLILKRDQAIVAAEWQRTRPLRQRVKGRVVASPVEVIERNNKVVELLARMKRPA